MISCDKHDYVEIACMYNYLIKLTLNSGDEIKGVAFDVKLNENREECLNIKVNNIDSLVVLDSVSKMEVLVDNPHFKVVTFK
jgi:Rho-binding antiterminator